ncbi:MAG: UvrD-helicase domain-containing protein [Armatimonadota bacterium]
MSIEPLEKDNHIDDHIDVEIGNCLDLDSPKSFFLFAGAGSGKTRSLVNVLNEFRKNRGSRLRYQGKQIAVITYTNAACDEIKRRIEYDSLFVVSTIHSFTWDLIKGFQSDIKEWLRQNLEKQIAELEIQQQKGRSGTQASMNREKDIENKKKRIQNLENIKRFRYNPNSDNREKDSLSHAEVIAIGAYFLAEKSLMKKILVEKFPILLIDESQDTNKNLMEAFLEVQEAHKERFSLGLFGDTMQQIYTDGKVDLGHDLPEDWLKPAKIMNHRCPPRIIKLINKIRSQVDSQEQKARTDKQAGVVRLFIFPSSTNKAVAEKNAAERMAKVTGDSAWTGDESDYKSLILEHHMAASRMGFLDMFDPIYKIDTLKTGLLDGSLPGLRLFTQLILPIKKARETADQFVITRIIRKFSPLLSKKTLSAVTDNQLKEVEKAHNAVTRLLSLWKDHNDPRLVDVLCNIATTRLFDIPDCLYPLAFSNTAEYKDAASPAEENDASNSTETPELDAWKECLEAPFSQIEAYDAYITDSSQFGTHQGIKGLEFPRVMVILSDEEAKGFLFSYEKLFGVKEKTQTDVKNEQEGNDTSISRTRRLFYVACSRAINSLAIVAYTANPQKLQDYVLTEGWFQEDEIEVSKL